MRIRKIATASAAACAALALSTAPAQAQTLPEIPSGSVATHSLAPAANLAVGSVLMPAALAFQAYCIFSYTVGGPAACSY